MWLRLAVRDVTLHPGELLFLFEQRLLRQRNQEITINLPIHERETAIAVVVCVHQPDLVHDDVRIEARVVRGFKQEPQHVLQVVCLPRSASHDVRHLVLAQTVSRSVTDGAVVRDSCETDNFFRKADGNFMTFFPYYAERFVAARARHQLCKNPRQNKPEIIRNAAIALRTE